jgi:hypothetical protein
MMLRYIEYLYLVGAIVAAGYLAMQFKELPVANKAFLAFVVLLCAFMFSFRRKQRQVLEEMDARNAEKRRQEQAENPDSENQNPAS